LPYILINRYFILLFCCEFRRSTHQDFGFFHNHITLVLVVPYFLFLGKNGGLNPHLFVIIRMAYRHPTLRLLVGQQVLMV
jgi:hypothetical protein